MHIASEMPVNKLLWIDMEMSGIDPKKERILEVAMIVTDLDFNQLAQYQSAVHQSEEVLSKMDSWNKNHHAASGLIEQVKDAPTEERVEKEVVKIIKTHFAGKPAVLAGNSIHQDRRFIRQWWPKVDELLHYRMLDVSAFKIIMENKYRLKFNKKKAHTAISDVNESIAELKYYLEFFNKDNKE